MVVIQLLFVLLATKKSVSVGGAKGVDYDEASSALKQDTTDDYCEIASCTTASYGVDSSFAVHYANLDPNNDQGFGTYIEYINRCKSKFSKESCYESEAERLSMNLRQPQSMRNYTALGFKKIEAPKDLTTRLTKFWNDSRNSRHLQDNVIQAPNVNFEHWEDGSTYVNHWTSPTMMMDLDQSLRDLTWDTTKPILEEWSGVELVQSSLYGIRIYKRGAILAPHVDRLPLVLSAVINVAQEGVKEPWPLELIGHDGRAYNVTTRPGEMILYESHSIIHGRPFQFNGESFANVFVHFEPLGFHSGADGSEEESLENLYQRAWKKAMSKCSQEGSDCSRVDLNSKGEFPSYIIPNSEEDRRWRQTQKRSKMSLVDKNWIKSVNAHTVRRDCVFFSQCRFSLTTLSDGTICVIQAASTGDLHAIKAIAGRSQIHASRDLLSTNHSQAENPRLLTKKDNNGWNTLHEAARGGRLSVVKFLVEEQKMKINERTHTGTGGSPLWWAKQSLPSTHEVVKYLEALGAKEIAPDGVEDNKKK